MALHHLPPTASGTEIAEHLRQHGYAIVDDVVPPDVMDRLATELAPHIDATEFGTETYNGTRTRRTGALIARSPTARTLVMHPTVVAAVGAFLSHVTSFQLHLTQLISISPGETAQKLHRDQMAFDFYPFPDDYHVQCNTMWAMTDFTIENGGTQVMAGSSVVPEEQARSELTVEQVEMRKGSLLFYDGKVLHGGGANRSSADRCGVNITYSVGWVRQEENQYLSTPPEVARTLDDDLLRMMGYQEGAYALGYVGDWLDPLSVLRGEPRSARVIGDLADTNDAARAFVATIDPEAP
jgi:ectoine hydroxylase-related dioxygenase (phytanoyl-CoA dioxygenase family)